MHTFAAPDTDYHPAQPRSAYSETVPEVYDSIPVGIECSENQGRVENRPETDAAMFPLNDTDFPGDLYVCGDEKVITPRSEQNSYTHNDPKILNMDGRSNATTSGLPEMPTSDLPNFPHPATVPLPPIQPNHGERIPVLGFYTIRECDGQLIYCLTFASGSSCLPYSLESTIGAKSMPQHICTKQSSAKSSTSTSKKGSPFSGEEDTLLQSLKDKGLP
jgi:hypothetical protein